MAAKPEKIATSVGIKFKVSQIVSSTSPRNTLGQFLFYNRLIVMCHLENHWFGYDTASLWLVYQKKIMRRGIGVQTLTFKCIYIVCFT